MNSYQRYNRNNQPKAIAITSAKTNAIIWQLGAFAALLGLYTVMA